MSKLAPLNERVREYMESSKYHRALFSNGWREDGWEWDDLFLTDRQAQAMYLASLQAQKDALLTLQANDQYDPSCQGCYGRSQRIADRIAEIDKLMETNQPNTTQGGDNDARD